MDDPTPASNVIDAGFGPSKDRIQPSNVEAEQALLGAILVSNEAFFKVQGFLKPDHFYESLHARIYDAMAQRIEKGNVADPVTLKPRFEDDADMAELGGISYLTFLASSFISVRNVRDYGRAIFDMAMRRGLIRLGEDMMEAALDPSSHTEPQQQIEEAEQHLYQLAEVGKYEGGFKAFPDALAESIHMIGNAFKRDGHLSGLSCGITDLDTKLGGMQNSDLIILAGRPGMGKSSLACNIAFNVAKGYRLEKQDDGTEKVANGAVVGIFSLEMSSEQMATRLLAEESGVPSSNMRRGQIDEEEYRRIRETSELLERVPLYIDDTGGLSIAALAARARRLKRNANLGLLIVDYIQLVTGSGRKKTDNRVQEISEITQGLKALAKELDIPIIALSQLSRAVENRDDKRPQLSDLRESGSIEQDADVVMFVFREEYYVENAKPAEEEFEKFEEWQQKMSRVHGRAEVIIGKQRHGPTGKVDLAFQANITKFANLVADDHFDPSNLDR
ncbi:MAG: replicative DNA helicase [Alphaproteobacteria bacterium]|nr:MAG: replicative DNA helicase [Alphaproteobacteria bacterium]